MYGTYARLLRKVEVYGFYMEKRGDSKPKTCQHYLLTRIQTACCVTETIKATSPSIVQMRSLLQFIHVQCAVQLHINEDFQGKVSVQGKMLVKLIRIRRLRLFVARTQINSWKRAFICITESR